MDRLYLVRFDVDMNTLLTPFTDATTAERSALGTAAHTLTIAVVVGAAAAGGVFVAFSTFVMKALRDLPDAQGLAAMQSINRAAPAPAFMALLFGTAVAAAGLGVRALRNSDDPASRWIIIGAALYLLAIVLTAVYHVPHNDALARLDPTSTAAAAQWHTYARNWTAWNHARALFSVMASWAFVLAAIAQHRHG